jgi:Protein of unknown function (DUF2505)
MQLSAAIDYAADPDHVFAMLTTVEFQERKCARTGALNSYVEVSQHDDQTVILTKRTLPTDSFPEFVRNLVGQVVLVIQTDTWGPRQADGSREGVILVDIEGAPLHLKGTLALHPGGSGTSEKIDGELKASVPLISSRIEKAAAPAVESAIRSEREIGHAWLAEGR